MRNSSSDYPNQNSHTNSIEQTMEERMEKRDESEKCSNPSSRPALPENATDDCPRRSRGESNRAAPAHRPEKSLLRDPDSRPPALCSEEHRCCHLKDYPSDPLFDWIELEEDEFQQLRIRIRHPDPLCLFALLKDINIEANHLDRYHTLLDQNRAEGIGDNEGVVRSAGMESPPDPSHEESASTEE